MNFQKSILKKKLRLQKPKFPLARKVQLQLQSTHHPTRKMKTTNNLNHHRKKPSLFPRRHQPIENYFVSSFLSTTFTRSFSFHLAPEDLSTFNELFTACRLNDIQRFDDLISRLRVLKTIDKSPSVIDILNYQTAGSFDTLLHVTSERGHLKLIQRLLTEGANPALANQRAKYPYNLCKNKEAKEVFRLFRHEHPDKYDYTLGQVGPSLSPEELERQHTNERERRRQMKKRRNEKQRSDQDRQQREHQEEQQRAKFLSLTDTEKRTLAVQMNFETSKPDELHLGRCWQCALKISDEPFTYYDYKFCSTACLKAHRTKSKAN